MCAANSCALITKRKDGSVEVSVVKHETRTETELFAEGILGNIQNWTLYPHSGCSSLLISTCRQKHVEAKLAISAASCTLFFTVIISTNRLILNICMCLLIQLKSCGTCGPISGLIFLWVSTLISYTCTLRECLCLMPQAAVDETVGIFWAAMRMGRYVGTEFESFSLIFLSKASALQTEKKR